MNLPARPRRKGDQGASGEILRRAADQLPTLSAELDELQRAEVSSYWIYHQRRYSVLLEDLVGRLASGPDARPKRLLDVGPNLQTGLLRQARPEAVIDTLGFSHPFFAPRPGERHIELDLNDTHTAGSPPGNHEYDVVLAAEVIEHLHTAPAVVLGYLAQWLRDDGVLILQTPNAVALHKRLRMLAGRNPYEPIRTSKTNPGHFHEYTVPELVDAAGEAGLAPDRWTTANYFGGSGRVGRLYAALGPMLPANLRHGITIWLRRG
jgi:SAM-dependent methyltransferase